MRALLVLVLLAGCGSGGEEPDNHGYGFQYDVQGPTGLKLRYKDALDPNQDYKQMFSTTPYYETAFAGVEACTGLQASAPFIVLAKPGTLHTKGEEVDGFYYSNPSLIVADASYIAIIRHEMIHYLLDMATGNPDTEHRSHFFTDC